MKSLYYNPKSALNIERIESTNKTIKPKTIETICDVCFKPLLKVGVGKWNMKRHKYCSDIAVQQQQRTYRNK